MFAVEKVLFALSFCNFLPAICFEVSSVSSPTKFNSQEFTKGHDFPYVRLFTFFPNS